MRLVTAAGKPRLAALALALAGAPTATAVAVVPAPPPPGPPAGTAPVLSASLAPGEVGWGTALAVSGNLANAGQVAGVPLVLQGEPYASHHFATLARTATGPDGAYSFAGIPADRNTRLRVEVEGSPGVSSPVIEAIVNPKVAINARSLGPGRTQLSLRLSHTPWHGPESASAWWFLAARGTHVFRLAAVSPVRALSPTVTYANVTVNPPSARFVYRVCLNPAWEHTMGTAATHRPCPHNGFTVRRDVG